MFPSGRNQRGYQASFKKIWRTTLERAGISYFRIYDLRSTYATRLSAGGVADEWVTQLLRQSDAKVFKKVDEKLVDRPPRYWTPARLEPTMLSIKNSRQPQLDNTPGSARRPSFFDWRG